MSGEGNVTAWRGEAGGDVGGNGQANGERKPDTGRSVIQTGCNQAGHAHRTAPPVPAFVDLPLPGLRLAAACMTACARCCLDHFCAFLAFLTAIRAVCHYRVPHCLLSASVHAFLPFMLVHSNTTCLPSFSLVVQLILVRVCSLNNVRSVILPHCLPSVFTSPHSAFSRSSGTLSSNSGAATTSDARADCAGPAGAGGGIQPPAACWQNAPISPAPHQPTRVAIPQRRRRGGKRIAARLPTTRPAPTTCLPP